MTERSPPLILLAIVDDHRMLLAALTEWLKGAAADIVVAVAVATWTDLLAHPQFPVDAVLLDLDLKDDLPVSVKLRALGTAGVATVVMSTYSDPAVVREALAAGAQGYLVKSEGAETIALAVRAAVAGERFVSPRLAAQLEAVSGMPELSLQERQVMALYSSGESAKRIAATLRITEYTAKSDLKRIRAKYRVVGIGLSTKVAMRTQAIADGLIIDGDRPSASVLSASVLSRPARPTE